MATKLECDNKTTAAAVAADNMQAGFPAVAIGSSVTTDANWGIDSHFLAGILATHVCLPGGEPTEFDLKQLRQVQAIKIAA